MILVERFAPGFRDRILAQGGRKDAADLVADLPQLKAAELLGLMEPEEAEDVRRLMSYAEQTAGGMMTPEPIVLSADATVAEALGIPATVRQGVLLPVAYTKGTDFKPAKRAPLETVLHVNGW